MVKGELRVVVERRARRDCRRRCDQHVCIKSCECRDICDLVTESVALFVPFGFITLGPTRAIIQNSFSNYFILV